MRPMGKPTDFAVSWGRSRVTQRAHAFWLDDDTPDADTSICGRASRLVVDPLWFAPSRPDEVPDATCEGCALMLSRSGARLELPHHREAKALRRSQREGGDAEAQAERDD